MIKIENTEVMGWEHAIRGMRNPKNSWARSDSRVLIARDRYSDDIEVGPNDLKLMNQLASGGPVHAKYRRMITVYLDITAPLYWWKEFDTYKIGTVANSCSTMHKIHDRDLDVSDFSTDRLSAASKSLLDPLIAWLNWCISQFKETGDKSWWEQVIQLLPSSYNQKRTVMLNYEVLVGMYKWRKNHKLAEWREFCRWIESLPYSEIITGAVEEAEEDGQRV